MATWTGPTLSAEDAFHQVWKSTVPIRPSFHLPITSKPATPPTSNSTSSSSDGDDEIATAEILAGIKFGGGSCSPPSRSLSERPPTALSSSSGEDGRLSSSDSVTGSVGGGRAVSGKRKRGEAGPSTAAKDNSAERWPPRKEFVYLSCVVAIPPVGRQKLPLFGKPCGRNEIIAKVVTMATGEGCSRKLISSHAQVLKGRKELSKQLRDLLTTEESKNSEDEAAPTVYTLVPEWRFPACINRLMGLPDSLDLRTAPPPSLIAQFFSEPIKPPKATSKKEKEKSQPTPTTKVKRFLPEITTQGPSPNQSHKSRVSNGAVDGIVRDHSASRSPSAASSCDRMAMGFGSGVQLPTPHSIYNPSPSSDRGRPLPFLESGRRPSLPSPSELFSSGLSIDFGFSPGSTSSVPRRLAAAPSLPVRPSTTSGFRSGQALPPLTPPAINTDAHFASPLTAFDVAFPSATGRRPSASSEGQLMLGKAFVMFEEESLKSIVRPYEKVTVEMLKSREFDRLY
ncbi:hypothetical protein I316_01313 [Kwoniella heveanensis BCC8398]|uniref:TEA domain-containing protein n=1 Tax=Kwoniella heveanensis BCC8398 TaxID=1296120 RepID=A0A1B9H0E4_9TREE|nr:hypothetical protein I316_01313 [Kwoniella heveanensis BCC8398]